MENIADNYAHIRGWGVDADPENEPTYPMKHWTGDDHNRLNYEKAPQQPETVEILQSNERPNMTRVFGTSAPPSGLSGMLRRFAFRYSESNWNHWLPLILADRVNMIEGIIDDVAHGHIPNVIAERGLASEWKYNRKSLLTKVAAGALLGTTVVLLLKNKNKAENRSKSGTTYKPEPIYKSKAKNEI